MDAPRIAGYSVPYNVPTIFGGVREVVDPGALDVAGPIRLLAGHHDGPTLARTTDGTLRVWSDCVGLAFEAELADNTTFARQVYSLIQRGEIAGCSISMCITGKRETTSRGARYRRIVGAKVYHIAVVEEPAYLCTGVWPADAAPADLPLRLACLMLAWDQGRKYAGWRPLARPGRASLVQPAVTC